MRILFYLPVVTPWWFDNIVEPLIRRAADDAELHVVAPPPWRGTGVGEREYERLGDLPDVRFWVLDGSDHPTLRTAPADPRAVVELVDDIAPDYVICRSADFVTPASFPGKVRYLMEAGVGPFRLPPHWVALESAPFGHGLLPDLAPRQRAFLDSAVAPALDRLAEAHSAPREALLARAGLPAGRPILLLPLEYEHEENFFLAHRVGATPNAALVEEVAAAIGDRALLAVTNHPLNDLYVDRSGLEAAIAGLAGRAVLVLPDGEGGASTASLAAHVDGMLLGDSKSFSLAAFAGTPMMRRSRFPTGAWLHAASDLDAFADAAAAGAAARPEREAARTWFGFHLANNAFDPQDDLLSAESLCERMDRDVDSDRWDAALARLEAAQPELFA